jgi:predicted dehydrogenase
MIDKIREGRLGALEHVAVCYNMPIPLTGPWSHWLFRDPRNLMFELGPHPISAIERLMGPVVKCRTLASKEMSLPSGVTFFPTWQLALECQRGTASLYLSIAGGFLDTWVRVEAEDGSAHVDLRRNTMRLSEKSHFMRPNDDLRDGLSAARMLRSESFRNYRNYLLSALRRSTAYPASYVAMDNSIRAFHAAIANGAPPPAGLPQGMAVVQACEAAVAPIAELTLPAAV